MMLKEKIPPRRYVTSQINPLNWFKLCQRLCTLQPPTGLPLLDKIGLLGDMLAWNLRLQYGIRKQAEYSSVCMLSSKKLFFSLFISRSIHLQQQTGTLSNFVIPEILRVLTESWPSLGSSIIQVFFSPCVLSLIFSVTAKKTESGSDWACEGHWNERLPCKLLSPLFR